VRRFADAKNTKADYWFRRAVIERAGEHCERCEKNMRHEAGALHTSHIFAGRRFAIRWLPDAAAAHCWECHSYLEEHRPAMEAWAIAHMGEERYFAVERARHSSLRLTAIEKDEIIRNLKSEYDRMLSERVGGKLGRIEFLSPYPTENYGGTG
jgi:hypothetical protein